MSDEADNLPSSSTGNREELTFIKRKGGLVLLRAGHQYSKKRDYKNGWSQWRCVKRRECKGSLRIKEGNICDEKNHICEPDQVNNMMDEEIHNFRETVLKSNFAPIPRTYNAFKSKFSNAGLDLLQKVPSFSNVKTQLYNLRNSEADITKIQFKSVDEIEIPLPFRNFVFYDHKDSTSTSRIIILTTPNQIEQMKSVKFFECDGTFDCCPEPIVQLYTIHGDIGSDEDHTRMVPLIYALLNNKSEETYQTLFEILKQRIPEWEPSKFLTDYEQAAMNAISTVFPTAVVKGCYFHFSKNVWKRGKDLNLTKDAYGTRHVRLSALLPLLPREYISEGWCYIMEDSPDTEAFQTFNNYMVSQWLEDESFVDVWCAHGERHRTTNAVESWHAKLKSTVPENANLYQLLFALKEDSDLQTVVIKQKNEPSAKRCKTKFILNNRWITYVINQLKEKKITVGHCLEKLRC